MWRLPLPQGRGVSPLAKYSAARTEPTAISVSVCEHCAHWPRPLSSRASRASRIACTKVSGEVRSITMKRGRSPGPPSGPVSEK